MKITQITLMILFAFISTAKSQNEALSTTVYRDKLNGDIFQTINKENGDTTKYFRKTGRFIKKAKNNILLIDGHKLGGTRTPCGCEPIQNGYWIEKYRNGNFKSKGKYNCGKKEGIWIFYYKNGQVSKIISWEKPYEKFANELSFEIDTLKNYYLKNGQYLEYYPNGQLKVKGEYKIVEEKSNIDTSFTLHPETFVLQGTIIKGVFWIPRSKKNGMWYLFDKRGNLLEEKYYKSNTENKTRPIEHRYWEMMMKFFKKIEERNTKEYDIKN